MKKTNQSANTTDQKITRFLWLQNGENPAFSWVFNPYEGKTTVCNSCGGNIAAGLEDCPLCGASIPGQHRSRDRLRSSPLTIVLIVAFALVCCLGLYGYIRVLVNSGAIALLLGK